MNTIDIPAGMETRSFVMEPGALRHVPALLKTWFPGVRPWIVADENTWNAAGKAVDAYLREAGIEAYPPYIFPAKPILHADNSHIPELQRVMPEKCAPVAVGGGTVNDLVKRLSGVAGVHYMCVPTAPSVDGYTSFGAAMTVDGLKRTLPCPAPYVLVADTKVLTDAPSGLFSSGYADLAAKIPGGADWVIVDTIGLEPIRPDVWDLVQKDLRKWLSSGNDVTSVFMGLAATGYSMQLYRDSRPASGAEHLFSHIWEMEGLTFRGESVSHGFKVCIGSLASVKLMETAFRLSTEDAMKRAAAPLLREKREKQVAHLLERGCYGTEAAEIALSKFLEGDALAERRKLIFSRWEQLRKRVLKQLIPYAEFKALLKGADCPLTPPEIGLSDEQFKHGLLAAQLIRKRYTILDLLFEAGLLEQIVADLKLD